MIKVSIVSYLNTIPLQYGLQQSADFNRMAALTKDIPSECAQKMISGKADVGLVPVAVIPLINNCTIITDYCISAKGSVDSVLLVSDVPLSEIKTIMLDYQSRTSVRLVEVLAREYWEITPKWERASKGYEKKINGTVAAVVIGDRTFTPEIRKHKYLYDLSSAWYDFTKKPFVFACWVTNKSEIAENEQFINTFNKAMDLGMSDIYKSMEIILANKRLTLPKDKLYHYLTERINYKLDGEKHEAMQSFLEFI